MERDRIANTAWACASCLYQDQPLLKSIAAAALRTRTEYRLKESGSLARALWLLVNDASYSSWDLANYFRPRYLRVEAPKKHHAHDALTDHSRTSASVPLVDIYVDEEQLITHGYALRTTGNPGDGKTFPQKGDHVCISYVGRLAANGMPFDAIEHFEFTIGIGEVIIGWDMGITKMSVGQEVQLVVHHSHAYREMGVPAARSIPPFSNLVFDIRLEGIQRPDTPAGAKPFRFVLGALANMGSHGGNIVSIKGGVRDHANVPKGLHELDFAPSTLNLSIGAWLFTLDGTGGLKEYEEILTQDYDTVAQIVSVYVKRGADGSRTLEPDFFNDMGVRKVGHRRLFQQWFEN